MSDKNAVSSTTMINGYVRVGKLKEARDLLDTMPCKNVGARCWGPNCDDFRVFIV